ncbi:LysR family transcriptional regulator [uncultured Veillonella sp.]|uniref:LysR family transcriptional regulator n=1 Tax=uncultured Veillonella sp. TaxID=159268 RepID=UPI00259131ED|nr:LysR family transcriptional regulator [uncultured Veillonella sp.]
MDDKDFVLLKTLYEEKNITHTAKRLFMSQPALSDRLKKLEQEFGCTLFIRQPRGITFTSEGELLCRYFNHALHDYHRIKEILTSRGSTVKGFLKIGCSNVFAKYRMPRLLSEFKQAYPDIEINMRSGYSHNRYKDFLEGDIHVCIARGDHNWSEHKQLLWQEPLCLFTKMPLEIADLPTTPYIHYKTDPILQSVLDDWWYAHFQKPPRTTIEVDAMDTALKLVQQNLGFTLLSQSCGQDTPDIMTIPLHLPNGDPLLRKTWMYYRNNYKHLSSVKAFVDFINQHDFSNG